MFPDGAEEHAFLAMNNGLAIAEGIECEAKAWRDVVVIGVDAALGNSRIAGEELTE